jgi:hypothetical protein
MSTQVANRRTMTRKRVRAGTARAIKNDATRSTVARNAYRDQTVSLLDELSDERLADVWEWVCPFPIDLAYDLPDRRGLIEDLADFAEALQPSLDGMEADQLCRLIEKYAAYKSRQSDRAVATCRNNVRRDRRDRLGVFPGAVWNNSRFPNLRSLR